MQIEITENTAEAMLKLDDRYFFDLFVMICTNENEEYQFRSAIAEIANQIKKEIIR